jgi:hypothetical protein
MAEKTIDDGGFAFPSDSVKKQYPTNEGMSLRDWLAGQALAGLNFMETSQTYQKDAEQCYLMADAMIAEKRRTEGGGV